MAIDFFRNDGRFLLREINLRDPIIPKQSDIINSNISKAFREA